MQWDNLKKKRIFFETNVIIYYDDVFRFIISLVNDTHVAEDLSQQVMLSAWEKLSQLKDFTKCKSWLLSISFNASMDYGRKLNQEKVFFSFGGEYADEIDDTSDTLEHIIKNFERQTLMLALQRINRNDQILIRLRYFESLAIKEIAEILDSNPGTIRSSLCRGVKKLRLIYDVIEREEAKT